MEKIDFEETFEKEKIEKIFNIWIDDSYKNQKYHWLGFILTLAIAFVLWIATQQFIYPLVILIYMRIYSLFNIKQRQ